MKHALMMFALTAVGCSSQSMAPMNDLGEVDLAQPPDLTPVSACPNDLPSTCPSPSPSWMTTIQPIIGERCQTCHVAGGEAQTVLLTSYTQVHARASTVLDQVYSCFMPPPDGSDLQVTERAALLAWLVCGAPNN